MYSGSATCSGSGRGDAGACRRRSLARRDAVGGHRERGRAIDAEGVAVSRAFVVDDAAACARELGALGRDPQARAALGRAGREAWKARYTWERIAADYEALYARAMDARRAA